MVVLTVLGQDQLVEEKNPDMSPNPRVPTMKRKLLKKGRDRMADESRSGVRASKADK